MLGGCRSPKVETVETGVAAENVDLVMQEVSYPTSDRVTIYGSWIVPQSKGAKRPAAPVVILLHDYGFDRRDWGVFIPDLVQQGYNVLAIDLRGHGKSTEGGQRLADPNSSATGSNFLQIGYLDVQGALAWIARRNDADRKHISVIGVGLGADLAYICWGKFPNKIRTTVAISPSFSAVTESSFVHSAPRSILFCAATKDSKGASRMAVESLANFTADPKRIVIYDSAAHGLAMFYKHPEMKREILAWLNH